MTRPPLPNQDDDPPWGETLNAHVLELGTEIDTLFGSIGGGGEVSGLPDDLSGAWYAGRNWYSLGTSITIDGSYTSKLQALSSMSLNNKGTSGQALAGPGGIWNALTTNVGTDAEVITMETINDFRLNVPLGTIADAESPSGTYYAALRAAANWILTNRPAARAFWFTAYGDAMNAGYPNGKTQNSDGKYYWQYNDAMVAVGRMYGIPVIDVGGESGINFYTCQFYTTDMIHMNSLGGQRYADYVWSRIRTMSWLTSRPTTPAGITTKPVIGVTISQGAGASVAPGQTLQLSVSISPTDASNKSVTWASNTPSVATVSGMGLVTGVANGSATVTVTTVDGGFTDTFAVTVATAAVTGVSLSPTTMNINAGGTQQLTATVSPSNAGNKNVSYSSSATGVATVNSTGLVTGVAVGSATITVTTQDGAKTATCSVTVAAAPVEWSFAPQTVFRKNNLSSIGASGNVPVPGSPSQGSYGAILINNSGDNAVEFTISDAVKGSWFIFGSHATDGNFAGLGDFKQGISSCGRFTAGAISLLTLTPSASATGWAANVVYRIGRSGNRVKIVRVDPGPTLVTIWDGDLSAIYVGGDAAWVANVDLGVLSASSYTIPADCKTGTWTP
jgi:Bacterial Ig-like domain (group 2)